MQTIEILQDSKTPRIRKEVTKPSHDYHKPQKARNFYDYCGNVMVWKRNLNFCWERTKVVAHARSKRLTTNSSGRSSTILPDPRVWTTVDVCGWHAVIGQRVKFIKLLSARTSRRIVERLRQVYSLVIQFAGDFPPISSVLWPFESPDL